MRPSFTITARAQGQTLVLEIVGELDLVTAPLLAEKLADAERAGATDVVVDLDRVEFMDSSGLHVLFSQTGRHGTGGRLAVTRGSPQVQRLFKVAGVLDRLTFTQPGP